MIPTVKKKDFYWHLYKSWDFVKRLSVSFDSLKFRNHTGLTFDLKVSSPSAAHQNLKISSPVLSLSPTSHLPKKEKKKNILGSL